MVLCSYEEDLLNCMCHCIVIVSSLLMVEVVGYEGGTGAVV